MKYFLYQIFASFLFSLANGVPNESSRNESFTFAEHDLVHINLFKAIGNWVTRAISDIHYGSTHHHFVLRDNKVYACAKNGDQEIFNGTMQHIEGSKAVQTHITDFNFNYKKWDIKTIYLYQDDDIIACLHLQLGQQNVFQIYTRLGHHVSDEEIHKLIYDKFLPNPNFRRLIEGLIPSLQWINKNPVKVIPGMEDIPIHYDDLIDADVTQAVGNWTLRATTRTEHFINKISYMNFRLEENEVIVTAHSGDKEIGMGKLDYFPGTKLWKLDIFFPTFDQYVKIKLMLVYVDDDLNISLQIMKGDNNLHLAVLSRKDKPYDVNYVKAVIKRQLGISPDIMRAIKDKLPKLTFF